MVAAARSAIDTTNHHVSSPSSSSSSTIWRREVQREMNEDGERYETQSSGRSNDGVSRGVDDKISTILDDLNGINRKIENNENNENIKQLQRDDINKKNEGWNSARTSSKSTRWREEERRGRDGGIGNEGRFDVGDLCTNIMDPQSNNDSTNKCTGENKNKFVSTHIIGLGRKERQVGSIVKAMFASHTPTRTRSLSAQYSQGSLSPSRSSRSSSFSNNNFNVNGFNSNYNRSVRSPSPFLLDKSQTPQTSRRAQTHYEPRVGNRGSRNDRNINSSIYGGFDNRNLHATKHSVSVSESGY